MARTRADLGAGVRLSDLLSVGEMGRAFPLARVNEVLARTGKGSRRQRLLPAHVVVYYVIALSLFMQVSCQEVLRCLLEGLRWLHGQATAAVPVAGESGISQARTRLGAEPMRQLHDALVGPIATPRTRGAWYRRWHLVSLDGSTLDVPDTKANAPVFGRQHTARGQAAFPQIRLVSLVENGTHVLFGAQWAPYATGERTLAAATVERLQSGMLCLADRGFYSYALWQAAHQTGADLLWRVAKNVQLPVEQRLADGSFLTHVHPGQARHRDGLLVRAIEYQLPGLAEAEPLYRVITTILDIEQAPAAELAALYHERWEIETALDELKTHLRGGRIVLRSKTPELVAQEFYGLMMAHFAVRGLMHEAALQDDVDPDELSFTHAVRVVRRKLSTGGDFPPSGLADPPSTDPL